MEDVVGINETGLKLFSETLLKYRDDIKLILDKYSDIIKKSNLYYNGEAADLMRKKFDEFSSNFIIVKKSFSTYSNDMITLVDTYVRSDNSNIMLEK
jgi:hypothetical protein